MGTIKAKLEYLEETKTEIREALESIDVVVNDSDTFRSYAEKISHLMSAGGVYGEIIQYYQNDYGTTAEIFYHRSNTAGGQEVYLELQPRGGGSQ